MAVASDFQVFSGNGTIKGFFHALRQALAAGPYDVIHCHSPHVACIYLSLRLLSLRRYASLTLYTLHSSFHNYSLRNKLLHIPVFLFFKHIAFCGQASYRSCPRWLLRMTPARKHAIPNGVNIEWIDKSLETTQWDNTIARSARRPFTVAYIGRFVDIKNLLTILRAFAEAQLPDSRLLLIGDGPLRTSLEEEAQRLGIAGRIVMTGLLPRSRVMELLKEIDLVISTSFGEGLPIAILEAMAGHKPVLLSNIAPHREIAGSIEEIPLVDPDDVCGFSTHLRRMSELPPAELMRIGEMCRTRVESAFDLKNMLEHYDVIFRDAPSYRLKAA